jgi:hypothetical protein
VAGPACASRAVLRQGVEARACGRSEEPEELSRGAGGGAADQLCECRTDAAGRVPGAVLQSISDFLDRQHAMIERAALRQAEIGNRESTMSDSDAIPFGAAIAGDVLSAFQLPGGNTLVKFADAYIVQRNAGKLPTS